MVSVRSWRDEQECRGVCEYSSLTCVAQMTGLPAELQRPIIIFWAIKTFSGGISMPRSPRATITPSLSAKISSKLKERSEEGTGGI